MKFSFWMTHFFFSKKVCEGFTNDYDFRSQEFGYAFSISE